MPLAILVIENPVLSETAALIHQHPDLSLFDHASDIEQAIVRCNDDQPNIILLKLNEITELAALRTLRLHLPHIPVVIFSSHSQTEFIQAVLAAGVMGFLLGDMPPPDVAANLMTAYQGQIVLSTEIVPLLLRS